MSLALSNAKITVARSLGGQNDEDELRAAGDAINAAVAEWNRFNIWEFNKLDNLSNFTVASKTTSANAVVALPTGVTYPNFNNVYVGSTVTGSGIPSGTTVLTKTSNSSLTLSANATATADPATLTFSGPIPILAGTSDYALPYLMKKPSYARLVTGATTLQYVRSRFVNQISDPTGDGVMWGYEVVRSQAATDTGGILPAATSSIRIVSTPSPGATGTVIDTLVLEYWRSIQSFLNDVSVADEARPIDVPDDFIDALLEMATYFYMRNKDSEIVRTGDRMQSAYRSMRRAMNDDSGQPDDIEAFIPQIDWDQSPRSVARRWLDTI